MGDWDAGSKSHVASMEDGDFFGSEQSHVLQEATSATIQLLADDGQTVTLKSELALLGGEVIDAAVMSRTKLRAFLAEQIRDAQDSGVLFSLHLKATMMKVSDPNHFRSRGECFL